MSTLKELVGNAVESTLVRWTLLALAVGAVPYYLLSMAKASLTV
jgi:hypothetical protein